MKLAIADPPYLPGPAGHKRATRHYAQQLQKPSMNRFGHGRSVMAQGDNHHAADDWNDRQTHADLCARLAQHYDGYAIAMSPNNLALYLSWLPDRTRVAVWHRPNAAPTGARVGSYWEPVCVVIPSQRIGGAPRMSDVLRASVSEPFVGAKPPAWTRWVLDMLGYDPDTDTVDDLFGGSGAVTAEIRQGVLL